MLPSMATLPCMPSWWRWTQSWPSPPWSGPRAAWLSLWSPGCGRLSAAGRRGNTGPRPFAGRSGPGEHLPVGGESEISGFAVVLLRWVTGWAPGSPWTTATWLSLTPARPGGCSQRSGGRWKRSGGVPPSWTPWHFAASTLPLALCS